jgi:hypothetical protein
MLLNFLDVSFLSFWLVIFSMFMFLFQIQKLQSDCAIFHFILNLSKIKNFIKD